MNSKSKPKSSKSRRAHKRNELATRNLFADVGADSVSSKVRRVSLKLSVSQLDDVELETALAAALRGDYPTAAARIARTMQAPKREVKRAKGYTPWREPIVRRRG